MMAASRPTFSSIGRDDGTRTRNLGTTTPRVTIDTTPSILVLSTGLKPATYRLGGGDSIQLSYESVFAFLCTYYGAS
jgi:hypothetical protein